MSSSRRPISANYTRRSNHQKSRYISGSKNSRKPSTASSKYRTNASSNPWELTGSKITQSHKYTSPGSDFSPTIKVTSLQPSTANTRSLKRRSVHKQRPSTSTSARRSSGPVIHSKVTHSESNSGLLTYQHSTNTVKSSKKSKITATKHRTQSQSNANRGGGGGSLHYKHLKQSEHPFSPSYSSTNVRLDGTVNATTSYTSIASRYGIPNDKTRKRSGSGSDREGGTLNRLERANFNDKDSVIFAIDPKQPQTPIVFRDERSKTASRERLNLDNRNLSKCPILRGEDHLRLLNYENNVISKIDNLCNLSHLIFLDLYNNRISKIENLQYVPMLRVLMLGRNQITKIENLETLRCLDVLDLHSNQISKIENLGHLVELRVLNLAGNDLSSIEHISTLTNLVELNLRRNQIYKTESFISQQKLQRILLSNNHFRELKAIAPLAAAKSIQQLTVDNNPFYDKFNNKTRQKTNIYSNILNVKLVAMFPGLRQLNNYDISDSVKKQLVATHPELQHHGRGSGSTSATSVTTNGTTTTTTTTSGVARSSSSSATPDSQSQTASNMNGNSSSSERVEVGVDADTFLAQNNDLKENVLNVDNVRGKELSVTDESGHDQMSEDMESLQSSSIIDHIPIQQKECSLTSDEVISKIEAQWHRDLKNSTTDSKDIRERLRHFELDADNIRILRMFGCGLPRMETDAYYSSIEELHFHFVPFNDLTKYFNFIKTLKTVTTLKFHHNNIHSLYQIDALSVISQIKMVDFGSRTGCNPITVTSPSLYRMYCIFRLPAIECIDGETVSVEERDEAKRKFSLLRNEWKNSNILRTRGFCAPILNRARNIDIRTTVHLKAHLNEIFQTAPFVVKDKETKSIKEEDEEQEKESVAAAKESIETAISVFRSRQKLRDLWPSIVAEYITEVIQDLQST